MLLSAIPITRPLVFVEVEVSGDCLVIAVAHSVLSVLLSLEYWYLKGTNIRHWGSQHMAFMIQDTTLG